MYWTFVGVIWYMHNVIINMKIGKAYKAGKAIYDCV